MKEKKIKAEMIAASKRFKNTTIYYANAQDSMLT